MEGTAQKSEKTKQPKISKAIYYFCVPIFWVYSKLRYRLKVDKSGVDVKNAPFLMLGNHTAVIDFMFYSTCLFPKPVNAVITSNIMYFPYYGKFVKKFNAIPKKQFSADFNCIKLIKRFMDAGTSVALFPEGRVTVDGTTGYISPTIGKLVKWLGYPVLCGIVAGGYVGNPKWGHENKNSRKARVSLKLKEILSKEEIAALSADEITKRIIDNMQYNDNAYLIEHGNKVRGKRLAEGLEKLLYKCPNCGAEFKNVSDKCEMTCSNCGNTIVYGTDGKIVPKTDKDVAFQRIDQWYKYQRDCMAKEVGDDEFELSANVELLLNNEEMRTFTPVGNGVVKVNRDGIFYDGSKQGEEIHLHFNIKNHPSLAYVIGYNFEVAEDENIYKFRFTEGKFSTKYILAIEELYKKYYLTEK